MDTVNRSYTPGDSLTKYGAERIIQTIKDYWAQRNKYPKIWIESFKVSKVYTRPMFAIRSDMKGGLPK